ncbi:MAG: helix-turn-helix transcriptional regulator [Mesorhizobium sp.]
MKYEEASAILAAVVEAFRSERDRQGLALQQLGERSGVSRTAIRMIERGQRSPSLLICLRIADALGLDLGDVLKKASRKARKPRQANPSA